MKKERILATLILLAFCTAHAPAELVDNFQKNSLNIEGAGRLKFDLGDLNNGTESRQWELLLLPRFGVFILDGLALDFAPGLLFQSTRTSSEDIERVFHYRLSTGLQYFAVNDPDAIKGFVPSIGLRAGLLLMPGTTDVVDGLSLEEPSTLFLEVAASVRANYFLNQRTALYVSAEPFVSFGLGSWNDSGVYRRSGSASEIALRIELLFGVAYFIPSEHLWNL